jgi:hypothetical protein
MCSDSGESRSFIVENQSKYGKQKCVTLHINLLNTRSIKLLKLLINIPEILFIAVYDHLVLLKSLKDKH